MNHNSTDTIVKMAIPTMAGLGMSFVQVESILRILALLTTTGLSLYVFFRDEKRRKKQEKEK